MIRQSAVVRLSGAASESRTIPQKQTQQNETSSLLQAILLFLFAFNKNTATFTL